ncbi:P-loop containing nucleoside triphosphate hydrolase protein [Rhodofomes roseus]|uniref:Kinesin-like protein n=1 Tax=Rhodofomes roseus TaxID=34475 RepID=A0ABQ8KHI4_9APHY|nr:P-loop containing nucleoside triphosphate hydrolase protein [Rhodofomes roseus]KAH9836793.1 P-loop containing nucleoside triphosphate hydrolase protein [Rhodofomes roseus]
MHTSGRFSTKSFRASAVFGSDLDNDAVYKGMRVSQAVEQCLNFDARELSILAYGQTSTGKTYNKVVQRVWKEADPPLDPVKVLVTGASEVQYSGLTRHEAPSLEALCRSIGRAKELRLTRSTVKNSTSSRSHSIIRLHICSREETMRKSQITIVDLAGSERSSILVQNDMATMKESIERLRPRRPVRGLSRLTMALKNIFDRSRKSSGQANKLLILACVSPSPLDVDDTLGTLRYVAVFQLGDLVQHGELKGVTRTILDPSQSGTTSRQLGLQDYIKRNWSKLTPVLHRLLPTPSSTMAGLLPLSATELSQLCATPTSDETKGKHPAPDARSVAQAKSRCTTYKMKMDALVQRAQTLQGHPGGFRPSASNARVAFDALSGRDFMAGETGSVTRVDARGHVMHNPRLK